MAKMVTGQEHVLLKNFGPPAEGAQAGPDSSNLAQSAVAEHAAQQSHAIDWEGATVIDTEQQFHRRCTPESWHIRSETNAMNREECNLPPVYDLLIHRPHSTNQ